MQLSHTGQELPLGESVEHNCPKISARVNAGSPLRSVQKLSYHSFLVYSNWVQESKGSKLRVGCKPFAEFLKPRCNPLRHFARPGTEKGQYAIRLDALIGGSI